MQWFHELICDKLQLFAEGKIKNLMINIGPQHGKTELATRMFPCYLSGINPSKKIVVTSYSSNITDKLNRDIQRYLEDKKYQNIFPDTKLSSGSKEESVYQRNLEVLDIINVKDTRSNGFIKTVGVGGSLTGTPVDIGIQDDLIKDQEEAQSNTIKQKVWEWNESVFESRFHNNSQRLYIATRWSEDDPAGRLLDRDGNEWDVIKLPAIKERDIVSYDPRKENEVLWEARHSFERMAKIQRTNPVLFNALYQQNPQPSKDILVFPDWSEIDSFPEIPFYYTIDYGHQNDPTTLIKMANETKNGVKICYCHELLYQTKLTSEDIVARLKKIGITKEVIYVDKNASELITVLKRNKFNIIGTKKGQNSIIAGISTVKEFKVYFTSTSANIRKERNNYSYIVIGSKPTNDPIDSFNHTCDAIRGALFTRFHRGGGKKKGIKRIN